MPTVDEVIAQATECGYDFECERFTQEDVDAAEAHLYSIVGANKECPNLPCNCYFECALPFYLYMRFYYSPELDSHAFTERILDYLRTRGCFHY